MNALNIYIFNNNYNETFSVLENFDFNDDLKNLYKNIALIKQSNSLNHELNLTITI